MKPERIKSVPAFMFYKDKHIKGEHMEFYQLKITIIIFNDSKGI